MLPLLKHITDSIMSTWERIIKLRGWHEAFQAGQYELQPTDMTHEAVKLEMNTAIDRINDYIREVEQLGCFVEEFKRGIVNFPSLYGGRKVFLCWRAGEDTVEHWHELDETWHDRIAISEPSSFFNDKQKQELSQRRQTDRRSGDGDLYSRGYY